MNRLKNKNMCFSVKGGCIPLHPRHMKNKRENYPPLLHDIWHRTRRPFRYPSCRKCQWEVYDANQAGCLKCGECHYCHSNAVDNRCPLIECDDRTRVCTITGYVLPEVRHSKDEYFDHVETYTVNNKKHNTGIFNKTPNVRLTLVMQDLNTEVTYIVASFLTSRRATMCREQENSKQNTKLAHHLLRQMKLFKMSHPRVRPNICWLLAQAMGQEKYWRFIEAASDDLVKHTAVHIARCICDMKHKGVKITSGNRLQEMVCGLLYMLKNGLGFQSKIILPAIPEVDRCLPHENKIEIYFGISSKVICMTENEVKLVFRESYQT